MLSVTDTLSFLTASLLLALAPGPDNLFVLAQSAIYGWRSGVLITLGLCSGLILHTAAAVIGVAALLKSWPPAFNALKLFGAGYLLYLAWLAWRADTTSEERLDSAAPVSAARYRQLYRRGLIMNITNPKVSIFFLAFLPQFADPKRGSVALQMLLLGGLFIFATLLVFGGVALMAGASRRFARSPRAQQLLNRFAALLFVALALKLAVSSV